MFIYSLYVSDSIITKSNSNILEINDKVIPLSYLYITSTENFSQLQATPIEHSNVHENYKLITEKDYHLTIKSIENATIICRQIVNNSKKVYISKEDPNVATYSLSNSIKSEFNLVTKEDEINFIEACNKSNNTDLKPQHPLFDYKMVTRFICPPECYTAHKDAADNIISLYVNKLPVFLINWNNPTDIIFMGFFPIEVMHKDEKSRIEANTIIEEAELWSEPITTSITVKNEILEGIRSRYLFTDRPRNGLSNVVIDSFVPRLLYKYKFDFHAIMKEERALLPKTSVAISPFIASLFGIKQVPVNQLIRVLGYTEKYIKDLMRQVKELQYNFVFVGAGGTGMNTAVWLYELSNMTGIINLFKKIHVYDRDEIDFSNLLRFPINPSNVLIHENGSSQYYSYNLNKIHIISQYLNKLSLSKIDLVRSFITSKNHPYTLFESKYAPDSNNRVYTTFPKTILYGAPSLEHRNELSNCGNFISATHSNNECVLYLNPEQNNSIQVESYGMIQLNSFFMNQLKMTIMLLEFLATDPDLTQKDKLIQSFEFNGESVLATDRNYNFQLLTTSNMLTEDVAINF